MTSSSKNFLNKPDMKKIDRIRCKLEEVGMLLDLAERAEKEYLRRLHYEDVIKETLVKALNEVDEAFIELVRDNSTKQ